MPPMITDDDASSASSGVEDVIPPKKATKQPGRPAKKPAKQAPEDDTKDPQKDADADEEVDEDDDEDDEIGEDEYAVEKILGHKFEKDGTLKYNIKWVGYDNPKDRTWEPEENLDGAAVKLGEYHSNIGGKPVWKPSTPAAKGRGRGKRKSQATEPSPQPESAVQTKRRKPNGTTESTKKNANGAVVDRGLPLGSWEDDVEAIQTIEEKDVTAKNGKTTRELFMFLEWKDGRQFEHSADVVRQKCPQKLLDYLLSKLVFKTSEPDQPAQDDHAQHGATQSET